MGFGGYDCALEDLECARLGMSNASFQSYDYGRKIRLALYSGTQQIQVPLNLTLQHAACNISCEGGNINNCPTVNQRLYWRNVNLPCYFKNLTPLHYYCVTVTVGDCCSHYTDTIFLKEHTYEHFSAEPMDWIVIPITCFILFIFLALALGFIIYSTKGSRSSRHERTEDILQTPLRETHLELENRIMELAIICIYLNERNTIFHDAIVELQSFLRHRGLNVIDIYDEEEHIGTSFRVWVQNVLQNQNIKIVLIDTNLLRPLWIGHGRDCRDIQSVEQAIIYTGSCIPLTELYNRLFVVRLEAVDTPANEMIYPGNGRIYLFPSNRERLVKDLSMSNTNV